LSTLYFAYGSNMNHEQMLGNRCPGARLLGVATLPEHRFIINSRGVATILPSAGSRVLGAVWEITDEHERTLDHYEGVRRGYYRRERHQVDLADGGTVEALVYTASETSEGKPRPGYLEGILEGARQCGLPPEYVDGLAAWAGGER
jgi:gamma-glutamylcyclotransferase (GGCT)/AIG2-like uncharacterized protein YtfP